MAIIVPVQYARGILPLSHIYLVVFHNDEIAVKLNFVI